MRKRPEKTDQTKADLREAFWRLYAQQPLEKITVGQVRTLAVTMYMMSRWLRNPGKVSVFQLAHLVYDFSIQDLKQRTDA